MGFFASTRLYPWTKAHSLAWAVQTFLYQIKSEFIFILILTAQISKTDLTLFLETLELHNMSNWR
jgi:hypothetical protein